MMLRWLTGILMCCVILCGPMWQDDCDARKQGNAAHVWWAPDSSWAIGGFGKLRPGLAEKIMAGKPPGLDGLKAYELQLKEPGEWLGFGVALRNVEKVTFTKNTKIVLIDREGRRIECEAIIFWPDRLQTALYDSRKMPVVVTKTSVWCYGEDQQPNGFAKFPAGSIELKDIVRFEVAGAIAEGSGGSPAKREDLQQGERR